MEIRFDGDKDFVERTEEAQKEKMRKMVRYRVIRVTNQWQSMRTIKRKNHVTTDQSEKHDGEARLTQTNQELNSKIRGINQAPVLRLCQNTFHAASNR